MKQTPAALLCTAAANTAARQLPRPCQARLPALLLHCLTLLNGGHAAGELDDLMRAYSGLPTAVAEAVLASRHSMELSQEDQLELQQLVRSES